MQVSRLTCLVVAVTLACSGGDSDLPGINNPPPPGNTQTLASITTNVTSLNLVAGNTQTITVTALDTQGNPISSANPVFTSASANIAEVDNGGVVFGLTSGSTTINVSVTHGSVNRTATVAVAVTGFLPGTGGFSTTSGDFFSPNKVAIAQGGTVTWTFGTTAHTVTFAQTPGAPASISETYSITVSRTFNQAGNFSFVCTIHTGMNGSVVVR